MAQIAETEPLDSSQRAQLSQILRQADSASLPFLAQYLRAGLAYRRQAEQKQAATASRSPASPVGSSVAASPAANGADVASPSLSRNAAPPAQPQAKTDAEGTATQAATSPSPSSTQLPELLPSHPRTNAGEVPGKPLAAAERPRQPGAENDEGKPAAEKVAQKPDSRRPAQTGAGDVVAASYTSTAGSEAGLERLQGAIKSLEAETRQSPQSAGELTRQARLRLLYLAAGRREDALRAIQPASPAMQDAWSQMIYGLATWMDAERFPDSANRAAETRQQLVAAANRLGELAPLVVRNMSLVKEVKGYGDLVPFEKMEFAPTQEVILYVEVENFKSEETARGFRTGFHGSYEIFDARGQRVASQELGNTDELCRNQRRDFYLNYLFRLPKRIYGGRHTLKLTVEDLHGQKIGQSSLEFTVKAGSE